MEFGHMEINSLLGVLLGVMATLSTAAIMWAAKSLSNLNIKIAVIVEKVARHDDQMEDHESRIRKIELHKV